MSAPNSARYETLPGKPSPLGATWDGSGVNFAIFSQHAEAVELCLFDEAFGKPETARINVRERTGYVWHVYLPQARPGLMYGWRVHGPYEPQAGQRFNANKLLLDPYAKATTGDPRWSPALFGYALESHDDLTFDDRDSGPFMTKGVVVESAFSWGNDRPPRVPWHETVIYEAHVKGLTKLNPDLTPQLRGAYAGLATTPVIEHLQTLGVTAIELLPVHQTAPERHLTERGLTNYWGYNTLAFFAPDPRFSCDASGSSCVNEFKSMVKSLHEAGIEVILDVVFNHTAEGSQLGPTLSLRGVDNKGYYRLSEEDERTYVDYTGTGNTLDFGRPAVVQLAADSLRYWVQEMHVDGFRFDLAPVLGRSSSGFEPAAPFLQVLQQDPVLSQVKLIAEPWDVGEGGYQLGAFPSPWREWNDRYRDCVRRFWRGDSGQLSELAYRLTGSSDLFAHNGRGPQASVNYVTCHDGFTLNDLVSFNDRHNEANLAGPDDGTAENHSWNCGSEGKTNDASVQRLREQQMRNFVATLALSQGVPMLLAGDEVGRTQQGNNNAYCQDNELSWLPWKIDERPPALRAWTELVLQIRRLHPILRRQRYFEGRPPHEGTKLKDVTWLGPDGRELGEEAWHDGGSAFAMWLSGEEALRDIEHGRRRPDDTLVVLFNAGTDAVQFRLPPTPSAERWTLLLDSARPEALEGLVESYRGAQRYPLAAHSLAVLAHVTPPSVPPDSA